MKIIISPAKKMVEQTDYMEAVSEPVFLKDSGKIAKLLGQLTLAELKALFCANDQIVELNYRRYQEMKDKEAFTPALLSYIGLQYQSMAPEVFTRNQWEYAAEHVRILSGFYGVLRPTDKVVPYRLEMQAKLSVDGSRDLYGYWGSRIYEEVAREESCILNLASKEYSKVIEPYLTDRISMVTCIFAERTDGKLRVKATAAKAARGDMVCWMAENQIEAVEAVKGYDRLNYTFSKEDSDKNNFVFVSRKNT